MFPNNFLKFSCDRRIPPFCVTGSSFLVILSWVILKKISSGKLQYTVRILTETQRIQKFNFDLELRMQIVLRNPELEPSLIGPDPSWLLINLIYELRPTILINFAQLYNTLSIGQCFYTGASSAGYTHLVIRTCPKG